MALRLRNRRRSTIGESLKCLAYSRASEFNSTNPYSEQRDELGRKVVKRRNTRFPHAVRFVEFNLGGYPSNRPRHRGNDDPAQNLACLRPAHDQHGPSPILSFSPPNLTLLRGYHGSSAIIEMLARRASSSSSAVSGTFANPAKIDAAIFVRRDWSIRWLIPARTASDLDENSPLAMSSSRAFAVSSSTFVTSWTIQPA
jgi:hypothetical protein